jgi:hypothetical protein
MKTAVIGEDADGLVVYNRALVDLARHYGFPATRLPTLPAKNERQGGTAVSLYPRGLLPRRLLSQSRRSQRPIAALARHGRQSGHATTQRVVNEAFAEEKPALKPLPLAPYRTVLNLERRVSHEGMVSIGGNLYSVPDTTRRRILDVHVCADEIRIFEAGALIASHAPLEGRDQRRLDPAHRKPLPPRRRPAEGEPIIIRRAGDRATSASLDFYEAVGRRLAGQERTR